MHIYKPGSQFLFRGRCETIDYVVVKRSGLLVYLRGHSVPSQPVDLAPLPDSRQQQQLQRVPGGAAPDTAQA